MKGMMLGFFDPLITLLENLIMGILSPVINFLMEWLVAPLINFLFSIVNYIISLYLYTISIFILGLIDFVEMLFRALAGLGSTGSGIELSIGGKSGDILLQLLRHQDVQQAFLAMCIVGIFLLIVTTVFQIIKVEYTTEGAKNSKTPIFQKAFKGLANLMLLPILCVFGIVFANQLLGLLDKATRADGNNPTISGTLFVTSASEAHYKKNDAQFVMFTANLNMAIPQVLLNSLPILYQSVKDMAEGYKENITDSSFNEDYRWDVDEVESGFINQSEGYKYYNIAAVSAYYNYGKINYLLLILGGVTVIKCLYFTCFGMVIRLYKCAVLFIISPAVIGMTPVNEGGLGKWRGQFIGQVLSAYGTILSINIFFIIVRVLLAVEVKFVNMGNFTFWGEHFMTGLLKSIFVMAGCLLIEKFAKELGGFFGAEDAMGAGKDMSKQVVDTAMKGVEVAGAVGRTIATGGAASLAATIGGVKNVAGGFKEGGIAGGLKAIGGEFKDHTLVGKAIGFVQNKYQANRDKDTVDYYESDKGQRSLKRAREQNKYSQEQIDKIKNTKEYKDSYNKVESAKADLEKAKKSLNREKITKAQNKLTNAEQEYQAKYGKKIDRYQNTIDANNKNIESYSGAKKRIEDREKDKEDKKQKRAEAIARTTSYVGGFFESSWGKTMDMIPGSKQVHEIDKMALDGMKKMKGNHASSVEKIQEEREDRVKDRYKDSPIFAKADTVMLGGGSKIIAKRTVEEVENANQNIKTEASTYLEREARNKSLLDNRLGSGQLSQEDYNNKILEMYERTQQYLNSKGADVDYAKIEEVLKKVQDSQNNKETYELNLKSDLNIQFDAKSMKAAIAEALKKSGGIMNADILRAELQKVFNEEGAKGNMNMLIQIEEIVKKVMNELK